MSSLVSVYFGVKDKDQRKHERLKEYGAQHGTKMSTLLRSIIIYGLIRKNYLGANYKDRIEVSDLKKELDVELIESERKIDEQEEAQMKLLKEILEKIDDMRSRQKKFHKLISELGGNL